MKDKSLPEIFEVMDNVLLQKYLIIVRMKNVERIKCQSQGLPTENNAKLKYWKVSH